MSEERDDGERGNGQGAGSQVKLCACVSEERGQGAHAFLGNAKIFIHYVHLHTRNTYTV